jgi:hypothetical protein
MANQFGERERTQQRHREDEERSNRDFTTDEDYGRGRYDQQGRWSERQRFGQSQGAIARRLKEPVWTYAQTWFVPGPYSGRGPSNYQRSNERIKEDVCERLTYYGQLDASNIEVEVEAGEVILKGSVDSRRSKRTAEDLAESVSGVRDVHNQLRIEWDQEKG